MEQPPEVSEMTGIGDSTEDILDPAGLSRPISFCHTDQVSTWAKAEGSA